MPGLEVISLPALNDNYIYLLRDGDVGVTAVVDPGEAAPVIAALDARGWSLDLILNTHHHGDHTAGNAALKARYGATLIGPRGERKPIAGLDRSVAEGDEVLVGGHRAKVYETPGHTIGHIAFWFEEDDALFCGDTLFSLGCGRVFEGTAAQMWASLVKLRALPDPTRLYCGHEYTQSNARFCLGLDPDNPDLKARAAEVEALRAAGKPTIPASLGVEKRANPFLRADDTLLQADLRMAGRPAAEVFAEIRSRKDRA